jgi:hypothetical protein
MSATREERLAYDRHRGRAMTNTVSPSPDLPGNLRRLAKWCQAKDPNATIWLHAIEAADALESAQSEIARLTTVRAVYEAWCREEAEAIDVIEALGAALNHTRAALKDSPNVG